MTRRDATLLDTPTFHQTQRLAANPAATLRMAQTTLMSLGFEIVSRTDERLEARSSGMTSSRQPPLLGASEISLSVARGELDLQAKLGGVRRMQLFILLFPPALGLLMLGTMLPGLGTGKWWLAAAPLAPWIVLSPLLAAWFRRRTVRALEGFVRSLQQSA